MTLQQHIENLERQAALNRVEAAKMKKGSAMRIALEQFADSIDAVLAALPEHDECINEAVWGEDA